MVRPPSFDSNGMKKGAWSEEEDNKLKAYVMRYGHWNWRLLPKFAGLARCGKSCRLRWVNYLKPGVRRGNFTKEEEELTIKLHAQLGNKWSAIATKLPGRTDNEIKNFWHTRVEKRGKRNPVAKKAVGHTSEASSMNDQVMMEEERRPFEITYSSLKTRDESASSSEATSLDKLQQSQLSFDTNTSLLPPITPQSQVDLWPDRLLADTYFDQIDYFPPLMLEDEFFNPDLNYSKLSSTDDSSYQLSGFDWIADDDHSILFSAPSFQGNLWSESASSSNSVKPVCFVH